MNKFFQLIILFILLLISQKVFSQTFPSPLSAKGGVDTHIFKNDTTILDTMIFEDGDNSVPARTVDISLSMLHSPYLSMVYIPIKYGLNDNFSIMMTLPFITKTIAYEGTHYIKSGYGDTLLGLNYTNYLFNTIKTSTTARVTLPTGNVNSQDFNYDIPLGYGGYTLSLQECLSTNKIETSYFKIRFFLSGLFIYYFTSSLKSDDTINYSFDTTFVWAITAGLVFNIIEKLDLGFKINYIDTRERRYKETGNTAWFDVNDSAKQLNLIPSIKYAFFDDMNGQIGFIYPVMSKQDNDLTDTYKAGWKIFMSIEKKFGVAKPAETQVNDNTGESQKKKADATVIRRKKKK